LPVIIASRRRTPSSAKQNRELHRLVEVSSAAIARTMNLMGIILSVVALLLMSSAAYAQTPQVERIRFTEYGIYTVDRDIQEEMRSASTRPRRRMCDTRQR
jgi:hypothetical protein